MRKRYAQKYKVTGPADLLNGPSLKEIFYERGRERKLKPTTIYRYWRWTRRLIFLHKAPIHPDHLSDRSVVQFISSLRSSGYKEGSTKQAIDALRFLYLYAVRRRPVLVRALTELRGSIAPFRLGFTARVMHWFERRKAHISR